LISVMEDQSVYFLKFQSFWSIFERLTSTSDRMRQFLSSRNMALLIIDQYMGPRSPLWLMLNPRKERVTLGGHPQLAEMLLAMAHMMRASHTDVTSPTMIPPTSFPDCALLPQDVQAKKNIFFRRKFLFVTLSYSKATLIMQTS